MCPSVDFLYAGLGRRLHTVFPSRSSVGSQHCGLRDLGFTGRWVHSKMALTNPDTWPQPVLPHVLAAYCLLPNVPHS